MKVSKDVKKMRYYESTLLNAYKVGNLYFNNIRSFDAELDFGSLLAYLFISTEFIMYPVTRCAFMSFFFFPGSGSFLNSKIDTNTLPSYNLSASSDFNLLHDL